MTQLSEDGLDMGTERFDGGASFDHAGMILLFALPTETDYRTRPDLPDAPQEIVCDLTHGGMTMRQAQCCTGCCPFHKIHIEYILSAVRHSKPGPHALTGLNTP